jgi:hypothetical protein
VTTATATVSRAPDTAGDTAPARPLQDEPLDPDTTHSLLLSAALDCIAQAEESLGCARELGDRHAVEMCTRERDLFAALAAGLDTDPLPHAAAAG